MIIKEAFWQGYLSQKKKNQGHEKSAYFVPAAIGAALANEGQWRQGAGYGAGIGFGTDLGMMAGGAFGGLGGAALGAGAGALAGDTETGVSIGGLLGALAGMGYGGYQGFQQSREMAKSLAGPKKWQAMFGDVPEPEPAPESPEAATEIQAAQ